MKKILTGKKGMEKKINVVLPNYTSAADEGSNPLAAVIALPSSPNQSLIPDIEKQSLSKLNPTNKPETIKIPLIPESLLTKKPYDIVLIIGTDLSKRKLIEDLVNFAKNKDINFLVIGDGSKIEITEHLILEKLNHNIKKDTLIILLAHGVTTSEKHHLRMGFSDSGSSDDSSYEENKQLIKTEEVIGWLHKIKNREEKELEAEKSSTWDELAYIFACQIGSAIEQITKLNQGSYLLVGDEKDALQSIHEEQMCGLMDFYCKKKGTKSRPDSLEAFIDMSMKCTEQVQFICPAQKQQLSLAPIKSIEHCSSQFRAEQLKKLAELKNYSTLLDQFAEDKKLSELYIRHLWFNSAFHGDSQLLAELAQAYPDLLSAKDRQNCTALLHGAENGRIKVVEFLTGELVKNNQKDVVSQEDEKGYTALEWAADYDDSRIAILMSEILLTACPEMINYRHAVTQNTILINIARESDRGKVLSYLIKKGAEIEATDKYGWTALMHAIENDQDDNIAKLIKLGSKIEVKSQDGWTPIHLVIKLADTHILGYLIDAETPQSTYCITNLEGQTPLCYAVRKESSEKLIKGLLLTKAAESALNIKDNQQFTPLGYAIQSGQVGIVKLLLEKNADIDCFPKSDISLIDKITQLNISEDSKLSILNLIETRNKRAGDPLEPTKRKKSKKEQ